MTNRYTNRTVEWGHWGITFMNPQPDQTKNYGVIIGSIYFPVGTRGPMDNRPGDKERYRAMIADWVNHGIAHTNLVVS